MKRTLCVAFCILALCIPCLLVNTGTVKAFKAGYSHMIYPLQNAVTFDGKWTSGSEWTDGFPTNFNNSVFRDKWSFVFQDPNFFVYEDFVIEVLNDNTNDTGDYYQICWDALADGGTAPKSDDVRVDIVGHTNATWYQGTGTGWAVRSAPTGFVWKDSMLDSPTSGTPHWICEVEVEKGSLGIGMIPWIRVAAYDASNSGAGVQAWPPTSRDVPDDYGEQPYSSDPIPESLNIGVVVLLSSVAVLAGAFCFRKRLRIDNFRSGKLVK